MDPKSSPPILAAECAPETRQERERALFAAFLENAPAAVAMFDRDMRYIYASRRWYTDYGLADQDIIGRSHYDVFPEISEEWKAIHRRCLAGSVETREVDGFARANGSFQFLRWEVRPWRGSEGAIGGIIMLTEEITDRQRRVIEIAEDQARFRAALAIADAAVWEFDAKTGKFYASDTLAELTGQPTIDGSWAFNFGSFIHPDDREAFNKAARTFWRGGEDVVQDHRVRRADGSYKWLRSHLSRIGDGTGPRTRVVGFLKDISSLKEAELAARDAQAKADAANAAKSQFLATMSHEIRTPMNGILGMASALETTSLTDDQRRMLSVIQASGEDLLGFLNDLLDVSKAEAGKIELREVDFFVPDFLGKVGALFAETAEAKGLMLRIETEPSADVRLKGDVVRIRQILNNLISNAVKFTDEGRIVVRAERIAGPNEVKRLVFSVCDTGIGIAAEHLAAVFEPFVQVDPSVRRRFAGTGLGLSISQRIAERMRGSITVTSELGRGSEFRVVLPLAEAHAPANDEAVPSPARSEPSLSGRGLRVLVAEDNRKNQLVIEAVLHSVGAQIVFADDGAQAVERWREGGVDLVLMDIRMPSVDGLWATRQIRTLERELGRDRTPIIALTADATEEGIAEAHGAGMDAHLTKPIRLRPLLGSIAALAVHRAE